MNESISALLDGECSPAELDRLLDEMERNPVLREQFSRQCLARESRMGTRIRSANLDFSSKVLAALHEEAPGAVVLPFARRLPRIAWKTAAGLAAAAAVGALAVLAVKPQADLAPAGSLSATSASVPASMIVPVAATPAPVEPALAGTDDDLTRQQLRNYLRAYSQSRDQQSMRSMLGYARYAAYTAGDDKPQPAPADHKP